jgi:ABC-type multidrug transport system permease subunit
MRYVESLASDRTYVALLLLQAPIIAAFIAIVAEPTHFQPPPAAAVAQAQAFGIPASRLASALPLMLAASATWFGAINAAKEVVKELPVFRRERLAGLNIAPYLASKVAVLGMLCLVQTAALLAIVSLKADLPTAGALVWAPLELWITLLLASLAALGLGLVISATMNNADRATSVVPIILIPQLIFAGVGDPDGLARWVSYLTVTHWAVEAMKVTARIPYNDAGAGFGADDLLARWGVLLAMSAVFISVAGWQLARKRGS